MHTPFLANLLSDSQKEQSARSCPRGFEVSQQKGDLWVTQEDDEGLCQPSGPWSWSWAADTRDIAWRPSTPTPHCSPVHCKHLFAFLNLW